MTDRDVPVMIFDTDCVLCSGTVAFVLSRERNERLNFVGAWSDEGRTLAQRHGFTQDDLDETFLVIAGGRALVRSDAGLAVARHLRAPWCWLGILRLVPRRVRDAAYSLVARHRYRWFGRRESCVVVPAGARHRFRGTDSPHRRDR